MTMENEAKDSDDDEVGVSVKDNTIKKKKE